MHTTLCRHATGSVDEYARRAVDRGLKGMTVTCHCPLPDKIDQAVRMEPEELVTYVDTVNRAAETWQGQLDIRLGLESDFAPFLVSFLTKLHGLHRFSYILGSVHPHAGYYKQRYDTGDIPSSRRTYYNLLAEAAETGLFDCLSHPDLIKNFDHEEWNFDLYAPVIEASLDRVARVGTCMELNTSGLLKKIKEFNPGRAQLEMMHTRRIPVVVGADAHSPARVGDQFIEALDLLADIGYSHVSIFLDRERQEIPIDVARSSMRLI